MFVAMNRFKVLRENAAAFEAMWLARNSTLHQMPGFMTFQLLKGSEEAEPMLYSSYTLWARKADFEAWTRSMQFRAAHDRAEQRAPLSIGQPQFEGFEVLQALSAPLAPREAAE
ncbi:Heme-degrading monooxygenase HmoA [Rhodoblastus acidophilus]|uniref:Heme-degrading monooxygenase HmoA n=1 Tax=Rhodoblastus acidophilus TaxID=1074 RepID=A0A212S6N3_RHOAC|nr:antibiotic biosynthesis monooxygenase [Rhodoblastus acidophilus]PPQ37246.1 antibiotic biosynthesis monooxygenase [Rhodoblastus acidophilus]RAI19080.1 antibiotic biosynthesis monooxygenase [Rhodoblastus acidophilus]SNB80964.1 Heme-degrading monooxygenase HmoA [Rhodoblastus acidophilus]